MRKCRVLIPEKATVRAMICCLESMKEQLHKLGPEALDKRITGFRIKADRSWEIETGGEPDEKLL
ncbi:hypothetical protein [Aneurinibacillus thermoaerophilus]|uniref:Uncharacterized protein n=1 Tax=Aneurinibacillus thermoaerophilus TaxID=143495 RepID=A0ABX8YCZ0_ANETH|nr:hypothetical protein [Aneurinibacillus thermoaerophilus]MED0681083.1 hypothetical protein [Aneurinibacillus thermoaerophilus]MED0738981.1 hypothetical protein [Aneurinibacillus thermoaerophilus]QYY43387.1 hypothetical protein K3F53_03805 [Aneurinibacillus thermoaerophilus]